MEEQKNIIIKCPFCGGEMILDEVFYRDDFSGHPKKVIRDPMNKVIYVDYEEDYEPVFEQHMECIHCSKPFIAEATLTIKTKSEDEELDFTEEYVSLL